MKIEHISPEEVLVVFSINPSSGDAKEWSQEIKQTLTGSEKHAKVDLISMTMVSSMCINVVVGLYKTMQRQGGEIHVVVGDEKIQHVFQLFKLDKLFPIEVVSG